MTRLWFRLIVLLISFGFHDGQEAVVLRDRSVWPSSERYCRSPASKVCCERSEGSSARPSTYRSGAGLVICSGSLIEVRQTLCVGFTVSTRDRLSTEIGLDIRDTLLVNQRPDQQFAVDLVQQGLFIETHPKTLYVLPQALRDEEQAAVRLSILVNIFDLDILEAGSNGPRGLVRRKMRADLAFA